MVFFLEGNDYHLETRLDMDDKMGTLGVRMPSAEKSKFVEFISVYSHWTFILIPFICSAFATYFLLGDKLPGNIGNFPIKWIAILAVWLVFLLALLIMILTVTQWGRFKERFTKQWQAIKAAEEAQKRKNNRNPQ